MKALGLRIQLGHPFGISCRNPEYTPGDCFTVLDIDGVHEISVDFCSCQRDLPHTIQLLRMRLWPATVVEPKTAATFRLLEWFHVLGNQSKVSAYEYFTSLARRTDNTGLSNVKVCLVPYLLLRMMQYI